MNQVYLASTINIQADHLFIQEVELFQRFSQNVC